MPLRALPLILCLALPAPALAQSQVSVTALGRAVTVPVPFAGRAAPAPDHTASDAAGTRFIAEWVPAGERVTAWSQMVTLTADPGPGADSGIAMLEGRYRAGCATPPEVRPMPVADGSQRAAVLICGQVQGAAFAEAMVALSAARGGTVYTLQWAQRFAAGGKDGRQNAPQAAPWAERLRLLETARF